MHLRGNIGLSIGRHTDAGPKPQNEDFLGVNTPDGSLLATKGIAACIADGVSDASAAKEASETAVRAFLSDYYETPEIMGGENRRPARPHRHQPLALLSGAGPQLCGKRLRHHVHRRRFQIPHRPHLPHRRLTPLPAAWRCPRADHPRPRHPSLSKDTLPHPRHGHQPQRENRLPHPPARASRSLPALHRWHPRFPLPPKADRNFIQRKRPRNHRRHPWRDRRRHLRRQPLRPRTPRRFSPGR